jgi:hypothetical protein
MIEKCPTCDSPKPQLHPAVQFEGEVQPCSDPWHGHCPACLSSNKKPVPSYLRGKGEQQCHNEFHSV